MSCELKSERQVTFTYPYTGTPIISVTINAPEFGDTLTQGRAQIIKRTRAGYSVAYDRGKIIDNEYQWSFENIVDSQRSALKSFLDFVTWGASKILVTDWFGNERVMRVGQTTLQVKNARQVTLEGGEAEVLWDFGLVLLDITDNPNEVGLTDVLNMASALKIHVADQQDPHNLPSFRTLGTGSPLTIDSVDIETEFVYPLAPNIEYYNKAAAWWVNIEDDTQSVRGSALVVVGGTDRDYATPAAATTIWGLDVTFYENGTDISSIVTLSVVLETVLGKQNLSLQGVLSAGSGWKAQARRVLI